MFEDCDDIPDTEKPIDLHFVQQEELDCLARVWPRLDERFQYILEAYYIIGDVHEGDRRGTGYQAGQRACGTEQGQSKGV